MKTSYYVIILFICLFLGFEACKKSDANPPDLERQQTESEKALGKVRGTWYLMDFESGVVSGNYNDPFRSYFDKTEMGDDYLIVRDDNSLFIGYGSKNSGKEFPPYLSGVCLTDAKNSVYLEMGLEEIKGMQWHDSVKINLINDKLLTIEIHYKWRSNRTGPVDEEYKYTYKK